MAAIAVALAINYALLRRIPTLPLVTGVPLSWFSAA